MKRLVLMTIAVLLVAAPAIVANTTMDFENYADGELAGQFNWAPSHQGSWEVVSGANSPMNGNKSINVVSLDDGYGPVLTGTTFADGTVASVMVRQNPGGYLFFNLLNAAGEAYCGAHFDLDNEINYAVNGFNWADAGHAYAFSNDYRVNVTLNFTNQSYSLNVQDLVNSANSFTLSNLAFAKPTTAASAAGGKFYGGGVFSYFDDIYPAPDPPAPAASWFDDFNAGPAATYISTPWENTTACVMLNGIGYGGTIGIQGYAGNGGGSLAHMFRPRAGTGNAYMVWKEYLSNQDYNGLMYAGLKPNKPTENYDIGWTGALVQMHSNTADRSYRITMLSYYTDGSGECAPRVNGPDLPNGWWEFKMEAIGQVVSLYYREIGTTTWNLIGTQVQDDDFAPNYVGFALSTSTFIDDVGFNQEGPAGALKGHVTLQGYTPVNATPVAMNIQLIKDGIPFGSQDVMLDANGDYIMQKIPVGSYTVAYKVKGFLCKSYSPVVINSGLDTVQPVSLTNGDNDGDNQVNSTDLSISLSNLGL